MSTESKANLLRGKWSMPGIPHKGWVCHGVTDLGAGEENHTTCEMCESASIRYVHHMSHHDHPAALDVGCVCAGHMEGNYAAAEARDRQMRNAAAARQREAKRLAAVAAAAEVARVKAAEERARVEVKANQLGLPVEDVLAAERFRDSPRGRASRNNPANVWRELNGVRVTVFPAKSGAGWISLASAGEHKVFGKGGRTQHDAKAWAYFAYKEVLAQLPTPDPVNIERAHAFAEALFSGH